MCDQTESEYLDGDVVWVKLGSCWWPGEVVGPDKLPPDVLPSFRKPPIAVVKFFQESTYEYVKNVNCIYKYNCSKKNEFINKGLYMYRTKHGHMEKFPEDVIRAETAVGGDIEILTRDEFQEQKKESYAGLFGDKKTPVLGKKGRGRGRPASESSSTSTPTRKIYKEKSDYKVHILVQPSKEANNQQKDGDKESSTPSTSRAGSEPAEEKPTPAAPSPAPAPAAAPAAAAATPSAATPGTYCCPNCPFSTTRLNVLILHNKTHSVTYTPYIPSPVRKKPTGKSSTKTTPKTSKSPKTPRPRKVNPEKAPKKTPSKKRSAEDKSLAEAKKPKTDEEIKSSLLADWDDDADDDDDEGTLLITRSPELPVGSESPAAPTSAELPSSLARVSSSPEKKTDDTVSEKPEASSSDSKYEFCEDEDWHVEADAGRKIPRVKNPKRKEDTKSISLDEDDVAKEVAELLNKTAVPELPSVPEPLKVEENFPEPSIVKSPDKKSDNSQEPSKSTDNVSTEPKPTKAIFKTKTFFRSRHSRSQDAIGKYVAEQLNPDRLEMADNDLNGSDAVSSPEARDSPPIEHVKVARLAPKIQLKKMKAEAAQLERERSRLYFLEEPKSESMDVTEQPLDNPDVILPSKPLQDVIYPTQEIKPINKEQPTKLNYKEDNKESEKQEKTKEKSIELSKTLKETSPKMDITTDIKDTESYDTNNEVVLNDVNTNSVKISNTDQFSLDFIEEPPKDAIIFTEKNKSIHNKEINSDKCNTLDYNSDDVKKSLNTKRLLPSESNANLKSTCEEQIISPKADITETTSEKIDNSDSASHVSSPLKKPMSALQKTYEELMQPYMSESTASAVDALLSVSREADRVPRMVGSGPPEDLFEDDNKDSSNNDDSITSICKDNGIYIDQSTEGEHVEAPVQELNGITNECVNNDMNANEQNVEPSLVNNDKPETNIEHEPTESDLQIAETLLNLPSIQNKVNEHQEAVTPMSIDEQPLEQPIENVNTVETDLNTYDMEEIVSSSEIVASTESVPEMTMRFETEQEKSENLNAAQSLVQMSESIDHTMNVVENNSITNNNTETEERKEIEETKEIDVIPSKAIETVKTIEQKVEQLSSENSSDPSNGINKSPKYETTSSKLLKMLEEPISTPKVPLHKILPAKQTTPMKQLVVTGKEKILNFDYAKSALKPKSQIPKQKIIIRRAGTNKTFLNNLGDVMSSPDKIILSRSNNSSQEGSSVSTFTIQTATESSVISDPKQIIIKPKMKKIIKTPTKVQKIKPHNSLVQWNETKTSQPIVNEDAMFDINSMPVVLSDDILTPESIEKMPIVMSDGNIMPKTAKTQQSIIQTPTNPPKLIKTSKPMLENEKMTISSSPSKSDMKTLLMSPVSEVVNKVSTTPNILSKSAKLRGAKPMLVIDKATGKQKIIMAKGEPTAVKEIRQAPTLIQTAAVPQTATKPDKFIILPTASTNPAPRTGRTQKIVIDPQTGKAHVLLAKGQETPTVSVPENKPVSAKLIPSSADSNSLGNTVMIITNAQGAQSRIVLTPEHEKILFPNKQQPNVSQLKTIQRIQANATLAQKTVVSATSSVKAPTRIVPKQQKSAIITSKGQLIVGGRVSTTAHNIAPMPEIRPAPKAEIRTVPKRIVASEPKKLVQAIQKTTSEPLIFLQQKSGTVVQLTAAQFEHLQRTGQIVHKAPAPPPEKQIIVQKSVTLTPKDLAPQKPRVRKSTTATSTPAKRAKQQADVAIAPALAPAPAPAPPVPPLTSLSHTIIAPTPVIQSIVPPASNTISISTSSNFSELDNLEELLPSTAIVKQPEPQAISVVPVPQPEPVAPPPPPPPEQPEPAPEPAPAQLSDGQLLAVPGENFGGPPGSFYLCVEDHGTLTPIDNRPLVLENNQLVPMAVEAPVPAFAPQPERQDILQAALANSDVFHADPARDDAPDFRDLNANVSVHCRVSETSTTLNQPIMTPVEMPTEGDSKPTVPSNLDDGLAAIGVTPHTVPTSLELPITVTDPRIAPKTTDPLSGNNYGAALLPSPSADLYEGAAVGAGAGAGGISMPLLTEEEAVGKSMPLLTEEVGERAVSSVESAGSPCSVEPEDAAWSRRLRTPATDGSDVSETSAEIPLQPAIQLSVNELSRHS